MATIFDGKKEALNIEENLTGRISAAGIQPRLVIVQVGDNPESNIYIRRKKKFGDKIGAIVDHVQYPESVSQEMLEQHIKKYNTDTSVHGIIIQLPIPSHLNRTELINLIDYKKDVDGLSAVNRSLLLEGDARAILPATTKGILKIIDRLNVSLEGKRVVIIGRSALVGKPTALACLNRNATVVLCHTHTKNLIEETRRADVLVVAVGKPRFITKSFVSPGQIVVDVGISRQIENGAAVIVGDVDMTSVQKVVQHITPVPGGVGQMTVACLFENLVEATIKHS